MSRIVAAGTTAPCTEHESVTVKSGIKYAANYWLHMYDFQYAVDRGCGNTEVFGNW